MKESIKMDVIVGNNKESELEFEMDKDRNLLTIIIDGAEICCGTWTDNLKQQFKRAVELWGNIDEE